MSHLLEIFEEPTGKDFRSLVDAPTKTHKALPTTVTVIK
jgi:hypothetical protein